MGGMGRRRVRLGEEEDMSMAENFKGLGLELETKFNNEYYIIILYIYLILNNTNKLIIIGLTINHLQYRSISTNFIFQIIDTFHNTKIFPSIIISHNKQASGINI